jgi:metal-responsive CopG/Arc/MetJ family transcriptional regulator
MVHTSVSLPPEMIEEVKKLISEKKKLGFKTPTEFIKQAIREYIYFTKDWNEESISRHVATFSKHQKQQK